MKIENTRPGGAAQPVKARTESAAAQAPKPVRAIADQATIRGIPAVEFTPKVREAILTLMAEVDALRKEIERNQQRIAYLEKLADQDALAPVANRRAFVRELSRFLSLAERYGTPSSLVYVDLDDLKAINDTYGHAAGDAALIKVSDILVANVRRSDVVGRMGGDEFAILLAHADEATATEKARAFLRMIESSPLTWEGRKIPLSAAFGVHTFRPGENMDQALDAADRAMYARKRKNVPAEE
jgi:diguanylate cyclase (GGDEF)-like protein